MCTCTIEHSVYLFVINAFPISVGETLNIYMCDCS